MVEIEHGTKRHGIFARLYHGETSFDFLKRRRVWFSISLGVIVMGLVSLLLNGLNFGIEFRGGTAWQVEARNASVSDARDAMADVGLEGATIQELGGDQIRVQAKIGGTDEQRADRRAAVTNALAEFARTRPQNVSVDDVGPSWGKEITSKAQRALIFFLVAIAVYITLRFEWKMAAATLAALVHDMLVTVGVYSLFSFEVTPATVVAVLTILGYSIYDGIVVFDKIDENTKGLAASGRMTYGDMVNLSMNQVLMRTLNTSVSTLLPILSLLIIGSVIMGAATLEEFALALLVGLGASAYSSIFIASPMLAMLKEREPRYAAIRQRLSARVGGGPPLTPAAAAATRGPDLEVAATRGEPWAPSAPAVPRVTRPARPPARRPPRPRKRRRR